MLCTIFRKEHVIHYGGGIDEFILKQLLKEDNNVLKMQEVAKVLSLFHNSEVHSVIFAKILLTLVTISPSRLS